MNVTPEYYQDKAGKWRWRVKARNGNIIGASSQGYASKKSAEENVERHFNSKPEEWVFYQDKKEEWRWRFTSAANGNILGSASEGYKAKADAVSNAKSMGYKG